MITKNNILEISSQFEQWKIKNERVMKYQKITSVLIILGAIILFIAALGFATPWGQGAGNIRDYETIEKAFKQNDILYNLTLFTLILSLLMIPLKVIKRRKYNIIQYSLIGLVSVLIVVSSVYLISISNYIYPFINTLSENELRRLFLTNHSSLAEVALFHKLMIVTSYIAMSTTVFMLSLQIYKVFHNQKLKKIKQAAYEVKEDE